MKIEFENLDEVFDFIEKNNSSETIIVNFFTEWCRWCKKMEFTLNQFVNNNPNNFLLEIDAEKNPQISKNSFFNVSMVPDTFFFRGNDLWKRLKGSMELKDLEEYLQKDN